MGFRRYVSECKSELKKVNWPTKKMIVSYTRIVLISTIVSASLLFAIDFVVMKGVSFLFV